MNTIRTHRAIVMALLGALVAGLLPAAASAAEPNIGPAPSATCPAETPGLYPPNHAFCLRASEYAHLQVDVAEAGTGDSFTMTVSNDKPQCVLSTDRDCVERILWNPYELFGVGYRLVRQDGTWFGSASNASTPRFATIAFGTTRPAGYGYYQPFWTDVTSGCHAPDGLPLPQCTITIRPLDYVSPASWVVLTPWIRVRLPGDPAQPKVTREEPIEAAFRFLARPPEASFTWDAAADDPLTLRFDASASTDDTGIDRYVWDFGDDDVDGQGVAPTHTFEAPGTYRVRLIVFDLEGHAAFATEDVVVRGVSVTVGAAPPQPDGVRRGERIDYTIDAQAIGIASSLGVTATVRSDLVNVDPASISAGGVLSGDGSTIDWAFANVTETDPPLSFATTVREDAPATTLFIPLDVTVRATLAGGDTSVLTTKLVPLLAGRSITIVHETTPAADELDFTFTGTAPIGQVVLDTDPGSATPDRRTFADLDEGSYTVTASTPSGWTLEGITCVDPTGGTTTDPATGTATIDLRGDDAVTCTFERSRAVAPLVVNSIGDAGDATAGDNCDTGGTIERDGQPEPECTLRAALQEAASRPGALIAFDIPTSAPVIVPASPLPAVSGPLTLDGTTQPGGWVGIAAGSAEAPVGLTLAGTDAVVRGLAVTGFGVGVAVRGAGHELLGNRVGVGVNGAPSPAPVGIQVVGAQDIAIGGLTDAVGQGAGNDIRGTAIGIRIGTSSGIRVLGSQIVARDVAVSIEASAGVDIGAVEAAGGNVISTVAQERAAGYAVVIRSEDPNAAPIRVLGNAITADVGVDARADRTIIGGSTAIPGAAPGNTITAGSIGIILAFSTSPVAAGNHVTAGSPFASTGIQVQDAIDARVGGPTAGHGNRITGFDLAEESVGRGIHLFGTEAARVEHNLVGVAADGRTAAGNTIGIHIDRGAASTVIEGNVASGNTTGIRSEGPDATIRGNRIGTDSTGSIAIPNDLGLSVSGSATVGGPLTGDRCDGACNLISGNAGTGVFLEEGAFVGNFVGTDVTGRLPLPNGQGVQSNAFAGEARIGGAAVTEGNVIAFNRFAGVVAYASENTNVPIRNNRIFDNGGPGIDLGTFEADGVTPNDILDDDLGPNGLQNFPILRAADRRADGSVLVTGDVFPLQLGTYTVDLFWNRSCDPVHGHGEGEVVAGSVPTSALALGGFSLETSPPEGYSVLTSTVTGPDGTSEFSACLQLGAEATLTAAAPAGATTVAVTSTDGLVGRVVEIGSGDTAERNYVIGLGSLVLALPLRHAHAAGEPVVAVDDQLFVAVDASTITRSGARGMASFSGIVLPVGGGRIECGEDVGLTVGDVIVAIPGSGFAISDDGRCRYVLAWKTSTLRFELDPERGTWAAVILGSSFGQLQDPVRVELRIGRARGEDLIRYTTRAGRSVYVRASTR